ncbi:MAG: hypothetical protein R3Y52_00490 [Psittacicella sp.]
MRTIEIEDEIYQIIAENTQLIGESASSILRRLLVEERNHMIMMIESFSRNSISIKNDIKATQDSIDIFISSSIKNSVKLTKAQIYLKILEILYEFDSEVFEAIVLDINLNRKTIQFIDLDQESEDFMWIENSPYRVKVKNSTSIKFNILKIFLGIMNFPNTFIESIEVFLYR